MFHFVGVLLDILTRPTHFEGVLSHIFFVAPFGHFFAHLKRDRWRAGRAGTHRSDDKLFHFGGIFERHQHRHAPAHRVADGDRGTGIQMI